MIFFEYIYVLTTPNLTAFGVKQNDLENLVVEYLAFSRQGTRDR